MDNFITREEFLKQSKKVQGVLLKWWKPKELDLVSIDGTPVLIDTILEEGHSFVYSEECGGCSESFEKCVPLLQIHQLIQFIEDRTKCKIELDISANKYDLYLFSLKTGRYSYKAHDNLSLDMLEALWQVTIEIAEEGDIK